MPMSIQWYLKLAVDLNDIAKKCCKSIKTRKTNFDSKKCVVDLN